MPVLTGWEAQAVAEAIDACRRLLPVLVDVADDHAHAIEVARLDWDGPHRLRFDDRVIAVQGQLRDGRELVSHLCRRLEDALTESLIAARVSYG